MFHYQPPTHPWLDIIYQDNDIVVLNKPAGLLSVPGKALEHRDCLELRVRRALPSVRVVHRLDMATSGLIVMALNKPAQVALNQQFAARTVKKSYVAVIFGQLQQASGSVELPLRCDWPNRPKQMVDHQEGKPALTHFEVIEQFAESTRVRLFPVTGRSHQLRVHMLSLGHPIQGDRLYGEPLAVTRASRLQLHAETLEFAHPIHGQIMQFKLPAPF